MKITGLTHKIEYLAAGSKTIYWLASRYYRDVVKKEIGLAGITEKDHVLCIGGGICPFSGILFHQATGARVTIIDNSAGCVRKAKKIVHRLGLNEYVQVVCQDGGSQSLSLSEYTVIHFAMQVCPMDYVFSHVERLASFGTKLLVRLPKKCLEGMYSCLPEPIIENCIPTSHKNACNIGSTVLYIKREQSQERFYEEIYQEKLNLRTLSKSCIL